jgi:hypothetical protein
MIEGAHIAKNGGNFSARDFARASMSFVPSFGLPLAQLLLLSCP